jgi:nitronate monooxygenase
VFDPRAHLAGEQAPLRRPKFVPIVSASSLATTLARKATGRVDGFVVEGPTAGGHNAPPRGEARLSETGEPLYGERDVVDLGKIRELGLPFWIAGGAGTPDALRDALSVGAAGVQVGTLFAYCDESGVEPTLKSAVLSGIASDTVRVRTDPRASPTGYPFKVVQVDGVDSQDDRRERNCDLGYLRTAYRTGTGRIGYRCAAEPVEQFVAKGGNIAETVGRRCLCNGLTANIGQAQAREAGVEQPLLTSGDNLVSLTGFARGRSRYSAADVIEYLSGEGNGS